MNNKRYLELKEIIASYMYGFDVSQMTDAEIAEWAQFLEMHLTSDESKLIALYGQEYKKELFVEMAREDDPIFKVCSGGVLLEADKHVRVLDEKVLALMNVETLIGVLDAPKAYIEYKNSKEEIFEP